MRRGAPAPPVALAQPDQDHGVADVGPAEAAVLRTEYSFVLPRGYVDRTGAVHRDGVMRLATARDELTPLVDERVRINPGYLTVVLLSAVVTRLGSLSDREVHTGVIEQLFASDLAFLQDLYRRVNIEGSTRAAVACPSCSAEFTVDLAGGSGGASGGS